MTSAELHKVRKIVVQSIVLTLTLMTPSTSALANEFCGGWDDYSSECYESMKQICDPRFGGENVEQCNKYFEGRPPDYPDNPSVGTNDIQADSKNDAQRRTTNDQVNEKFIKLQKDADHHDRMTKVEAEYIVAIERNIANSNSSIKEFRLSLKDITLSKAVKVRLKKTIQSHLEIIKTNRCMLKKARAGATYQKMSSACL
jgi:hypothetical protein